MLKVVQWVFVLACISYVMLLSGTLHPTAQHAMLVILQPAVLPIILLWLWGARLKGFRASGIEYELCFAARDRKNLVPGEDIQALALVLASITAGNFFACTRNATCTTPVNLTRQWLPVSLVQLLAL
jgi:hypothetical protein